MDRNTAVTTWRDVCVSDTVMAMPPTGHMLEEFARRIEAMTLRAERPGIEPVAQVVALEPEGPDGHGVNWLAGKRPKPGDLLFAAPQDAEELRAALKAANTVLQENKRRINAEPGSPVDKIIRATAKMVDLGA